MPNCFICGNELTQENKSQEHIIPNALGGRLVSDQILCGDDNNRLGTELDASFIKIFSPLYKRMGYGTDRQINRTFEGIHKDLGIKVIHDGEKIYPYEPYYVEETHTLYVRNKVQERHYKRKLDNDGINTRTLNVLNDLTGEIIFEFNIENEVFRKGISKIASGFASSLGFDRSDLAETIDREKNSLKDVPIIPYIFNEYEMLLMAHQNPFYPTHILSLHGDTKDNFLYCYVELFSTFKFYVILSSDYGGEETHEFYIYSLSQEEEKSLDEYLNQFPNASLWPFDYKYFKKRNMDSYIDEYASKAHLFKMNGHLLFNKLNTYLNNNLT